MFIKAEEFLKISSQFQLGHLVTESFHPKTAGLSQLVKKDVMSALRLLQEVDRDALELMKGKEEVVWEMAKVIQKTLQEGHKVFMCGCGATGRLSLVLETLFRQKFGATDKVVSFMAGGDYALIKSVESFEDRVDYGERQLMELGFGPHDLLLAPTEGGETPFVIGATLKASQVSDKAPYFLYCNPDELLMPIERSKNVLLNPKVKKVNLTVGPMAISGSTRMQASTVLMLAIGVGLLYSYSGREEFSHFFQNLLKRLVQTDYGLLGPLTKLEAKLYQEKKFLNYVADPQLAISILTDTTERSPTFSLKAFENRLDSGSEHSLSYLFVRDAEESGVAWAEMLGRPPRPLEWQELNGKINQEKLLGFDVSLKGMRERSRHVATENFFIHQKGTAVEFECQQDKAIFDLGEDRLFNHLMIKMLLNAHSTSIMGLLNRYEGNVMTWVRPSNNKLIDRAARYVTQILKQKSKKADYESVVKAIFREMELPHENAAIVLRVVDVLCHSEVS